VRHGELDILGGAEVALDLTVNATPARSGSIIRWTITFICSVAGSMPL
jgi:hypothetical protein